MKDRFRRSFDNYSGQSFGVQEVTYHGTQTSVGGKALVAGRRVDQSDNLVALIQKQIDKM